MYVPHLTMLLHAETKVGKTWLAATAPKPLLVLDAEAGGMRFVPDAKYITKWDPLRSKPPEMLLDDDDPNYWTICQVDVTDETVLSTAIQYLMAGNHPFSSIVIDSITELQTRLKRKMANDQGLLRIQDWGALLTKIELLVEQCRDMANVQEQIKAFVAVAGSQPRDGKMQPMMQGQIANKLPYKIDVCGYLYIANDEDGNRVRVLQMSQNDTAVAGNRLGGHLPDFQVNPNINDMLIELTDSIEKSD